MAECGFLSSALFWRPFSFLFPLFSCSFLCSFTRFSLSYSFVLLFSLALFSFSFLLLFSLTLFSYSLFPPPSCAPFTFNCQVRCEPEVKAEQGIDHTSSQPTRVTASPVSRCPCVVQARWDDGSWTCLPMEPEKIAKKIACTGNAGGETLIGPKRGT